VRVELALAQHEPVAGRVRGHGARPAAKGAAQPGDVHPQGGHAVRRRLAFPQVIGEPVGGNDLAGRQQQPCQQGAFPEPAQVFDLAIVRYLDGPEDAELDDGQHLPMGARG
jgi:hypothetical protein